jgi:16S rRNA (adenine1518-N6/adenine1519-N6)-dimethyltransferase
MYVTVQREVAERMTASPDNKDYGVLSILLAAAGDVKLLKILHPSVFWPAPRVDSAMVSFIRNQEKIKQIHDIRLLSDIVSLFMQHRRKMLKACTKLAEGDLARIHNWSLIFQDCCIDPHARPEQLTPQNYVSLANQLCAQLNSGTTR